MNKLIKNELTKIFHKKAIYIVLAITIAFMILNAVMTKVFFENSIISYGNDDVEFYKEQLSLLDKNNPADKDMYIMFKTDLEVAELSRKYDENSWQRYIISEEGNDVIQYMVETENTAKYEEAKKEYDHFIEKLNSGNWKAFAQEQLDEVNAQIKEMEESKILEKNPTTQNGNEQQIMQRLKDQKQELEWRLEKDIAYGISNKNQILDQWILGKQQLIGYEEQEKEKPLTYNEKYEKKNIEELVALSEYAIINDTEDKIELSEFNNRYNLASSADSDLIDSFYIYTIFITIVMVIIAGTIVSEEFNKGTIKLLLVRPYKRIKILFAKFITCLIVLAIVYAVVVLAQFVVGGCFNGFSDYTSKVVIYNFNTNTVDEIGTFKYLLLSGVSILPELILIMTLAFSLSAIFVNSPIAIALPLLGIMGADIINQLAYNFEKAKFLMYFVTPNWDLRIFLFGKLPQFEPISLPFSAVICLIYFIIMIFASVLVFKKKEIKNI